MIETLKRFLAEEKGQGMAEYGLILALVAVIVVVALGPLGTKIASVFTDVTGKM